MATKSPENPQSLKLTVTLDTGEVIGPADTTMSPFGQQERFVSVFQGDNIVIYPMHRVSKIEMSFGE
jgi:hypothetical protein